MPARPRSASPVVSAEVRVLAEGCGNHLASAARRLVDRRRLEHRGVHERVRLQDLQQCVDLASGDQALELRGAAATGGGPHHARPAAIRGMHAHGGGWLGAWLAHARTHELKLPVPGPAARVAAMPSRGPGGGIGVQGTAAAHPFPRPARCAPTARSTHAGGERVTAGGQVAAGRGAKLRQRTAEGARSPRPPAARRRPNRRCTRQQAGTPAGAHAPWWPRCPIPELLSSPLPSHGVRSGVAPNIL